MTDRPNPADPDSVETPEIAEVRRLLAEARHTGPMPDDVAARMDDVLADLRTDRPAVRRRDDVVIPIAAHRRRKVAGLLVAAAAIVVGGVTIAPHLGSGSDSVGSAAEDKAGGSTSQSLGNTGNQPPKASAPSARDNSAQIQKGLVVVRPRHFSTDAREGRVLLQNDSLEMRSAQKVPCPDVPGPGHRVPAEYQHAPAVLVYRRAEGSTQVVDLYVCGNPRPVRSTTLPVP